MNCMSKLLKVTKLNIKLKVNISNYILKLTVMHILFFKIMTNM